MMIRRKTDQKKISSTLTNYMMAAKTSAATAKQICADICVATDLATLNEIRLLRKSEYKSVYPEMDLTNDSLDSSALILYTKDKKGRITSTARLAFEGPVGFPQEPFLKDYRKQKKRLIELGRLVVKNGNGSLLRAYYRSFYTLASNLHCDAIIMTMQPRHVNFHKNVVGANVIADMGFHYGSSSRLFCVAWEIADTKPKFFRWLGVQK